MSAVKRGAWYAFGLVGWPAVVLLFMVATESGFGQQLPEFVANSLVIATQMILAAVFVAAALKIGAPRQIVWWMLASTIPLAWIALNITWPYGPHLPFSLYVESVVLALAFTVLAPAFGAFVARWLIEVSARRKSPGASTGTATGSA